MGRAPALSPVFRVPLLLWSSSALWREVRPTGALSYFKAQNSLLGSPSCVELLPQVWPTEATMLLVMYL